MCTCANLVFRALPCGRMIAHYNPPWWITRRTPAAHKNVQHSLHKLVQTDCFAALTKKNKLSVLANEFVKCKRFPLCTHCMPAAHKNVPHLLHKLPQIDCFATQTNQKNELPISANEIVWCKKFPLSTHGVPATLPLVKMYPFNT